MKSIMTILLLIITLSGLAQTNSIIGEHPSKLSPMVSELSEFFKVEMRRAGDPFTNEKIQYLDSLRYHGITINSKSEETFEGTTKSTAPPKVYDIQITAPLNQIMKLFDFYKIKFKTYKGYKTSEQFIQFENVNLYWTEMQTYNESKVPMGYIFMEKK